MPEIDGRSLTLSVLRDVADGKASVTLAESARARMKHTRKYVERAVEAGEPVYGINTGFGKLSDVAIPRDKLAELQHNLVRSHAAGVGDALPEREVRAMLLLRTNVLATGYAGARAEVADALLAILNSGICPVVPEQGSVGASGDLAPLAHLALTLIGEGEATLDGVRGPSAALLSSKGLSPVVLHAKEGLALINGTQAHTAVAALAAVELASLWHAAHIASAMSLEALLGTPVAYDERIHDARGQSGQKYSAALLRGLLADSEIRESHRLNDPRVQDAYSLRCAPHVHGPVYDTIRFASTIIEAELNAATDNPLVLDDGTLLSGGNFHGQAVAMASDMLAIACANLAVISERRTDRVVHPDLNEGLPPFLARQPGLESGFMMQQVTAAALASECKTLAHPASVDSIPTDGNKEDVVPMAMGAAVKLRRSVRNLRNVIAIELMAAAEGLEHRRPLRSSVPVEQAHALIRTMVPASTGDRVWSNDIARLSDALKAGAFDMIQPVTR